MSNHEEWVRRYTEVQPIYSSFVNQLKELLRNLLEQAGIKNAMIDGRAKSVTSFSEKVVRPGKSYSDPLQEVTDLAGVRIIVSNLGPLHDVCKVVDGAFEIDSRSVNKLDELGADRFGYLSVHKVVRLGQDRSGLPEWKRYSGLVAEIQVRTILQHAWAGISHSLQYKQEQDIPTPFRRRLVRVASLLELADDEFLSVLNRQREYGREVETSLTKHNLEIPLSSDSLRLYLKESDVTHAIEELGINAGFEVTKNLRGARTDLLATCRMIGINTVRALDSDLQATKAKAQEYLTKLLVASPGSWTVSRAFLMELLLIAKHHATLPKGWHMKERWDDGIYNRVVNTAKAVYG